MDIHNLMEDLVTDSVEEIFADQDYIERAGCHNSESCKNDVICYVLNRIPPIYTTSSRGLAHVGKAYIDKPQSVADIVALANEGIRQVGMHLRNESLKTPEIPEPPLFNFPIIKGKVMDGKTFAPYSGGEISLHMNRKPVLMHGTRWNNPCKLVDETEGEFLFWPLPVKAKSVGENRSFSMSIELNAEGYKPVRHYINIELAADNDFIDSMKANKIFRIEPIYIFGENEPEEITQ